MASNTSPSRLRTVIIKPGEKIILPQEAVIQSVVLDGSIDVSSTCNNLPPFSSYRCGYFHLIVDNDDDDGHSMDERETYITKLIVGDNIYNINKKVIYIGDNPGSLSTPDMFNAHVPDQSIFTFTRIQKAELSKRQGIYIYFKTVDALFPKVEIEVSNFGSVSYYKGNVVECDTYEYGMDTSIKDDILGPSA